MTVDEFYELVNEDSPFELVNGVIVVPSPASYPHEALFIFVGSVMTSYVVERHLGQVCGSRMSVRIDDYNCWEPDLWFVSARRAHVISEQELTEAPDLIIEILSPGDSRSEVVAKQAQYERIGVKELWVLDQPKRRLAIHHLNNEGRYELLPVVDGMGRSRVIPGFYLREDWLWREPLDYPSPFQVVKELLGATDRSRSARHLDASPGLPPQRLPLALALRFSVPLARLRGYRFNRPATAETMQQACAPEIS